MKGSVKFVQGNEACVEGALGPCGGWLDNTSGYASARRKHLSIKILAHLIRPNRSS